MTTRAYRTIAALMSVSLLSFLVIQFLWIRNSYDVAEKEINRSLTEAVNRAARKLELRSGVSQLKERMISINTSDSAAFADMKIVVKKNGDCSQDITRLKKNTEKMTLPVIPEHPLKVMVLDSFVQNQKVIVRKMDSGSSAVNGFSDVDVLVTKMLKELKQFDATPFTKISADTLKAIIAKELSEGGIAESFDFAITSGKDGSVVVKSDGYRQNESMVTFSQAIFRENVLKTSDRLHLQFSSLSGMVYSGMRAMLFASAFFALFILFAFAWTLRLVARQKKIAEIKNDFMNNMTHELKTPIATIAVAADALCNSKVRTDEERFNYYASVVKEQNNKMHQNVERVLQLAVTEKSQFSLQLSVVHIDAFIQKCMANFKVLAEANNASVHFTGAGPDATVFADAFHLENVIGNLIDNAIKYSGDKPEVKIVCNLDKAGVKISVEDSGAGMSDDLKKRVFEKFYRGQGGDLHEVKGFGIGLSYAYNIVKAHGGTILVESRKGQGSKFTIVLPAEKK